MDPTRFDRLTRALSTTPTRRLILTALAKLTTGTTLAALVVVPQSDDAAARICRELFQQCRRTRQCCGHKKKGIVCANNAHSGSPVTDQHKTCCIASGESCEFESQCCRELGCFRRRCTDLK